MDTLLIDPRTRGKYDERRDRVYAHNFGTRAERPAPERRKRHAMSTIQRVIRRYLNGDRMSVISVEEKISMPTIYEYLRRHNVELRGAGRKS